MSARTVKVSCHAETQVTVDVDVGDRWATGG